MLFERHHAQTYRYCLRHVFTAEDAEDCLSEAYVELWRARRSFEVRDSALPVILAVAKRVTQKHLRSAHRRDTSLRRQASLRILDEQDVADTIDEAATLGDRLRWLHGQVELLSPGDRAVFDLVMYAELSHQEVATILGIPVGTVKSRLHRARAWINEAARQVDRQKADVR